MFKGFNDSNIYIEGKGIIKTSLFVEDGIIKNFEKKDGTLHLRDDLIVVPGFIDKHTHGANHSDAMYPTYNDILNIASIITKEGITSFLPTTMTVCESEIKKALNNISEYMKKPSIKAANVIGVHLEGPFISEKHKGAQNKEAILKCSVEKFQEFQKASGNNIKEVTLAPEEDGFELIKYLNDNKIVASLGHTDSSFEVCKKAASYGATSVTHTYNAQKALHHRDVGTVGACFLLDELYAEIICDLIHVSKEALQILYKMKGKDKITLITDSMEAKHLENGMYKLGGQDVIVKDGAARLLNGTLAGSTLKMNDAIRNIKNALNIKLEDAIDFATINPAKNLYIDDKKGSIKIGKDADFTIIDNSLNVYMTIVGGEIVYIKEGNDDILQ